MGSQTVIVIDDDDDDGLDDQDMRSRPFNSSVSFTDQQDENENPTVYHMHNPYDAQRLIRWLSNFDDIPGKQETIFPFSSLPKLPDHTRITHRPEEFHEIILSDKSLLTLPSIAERIEAGIDADNMAEWLPQWATELQRLKKQQHHSNLQEQGVKPTRQPQARPATYRTKQAKDFRSLVSNELLSGHSIEAFMKLPVMQRLATYRDKLEAPGMIEMCDPSTISTDLATHCIGSIPNQHARSFLAASALSLLPPRAQEAWREAQRHFWRNNVFVVNASHIIAVLNSLNARIKSYIGMIHVDLEALDDMDELACYDSSHLNGNNSQTLEAIRQQNQDLRRLMEECYDLAWARIHVHSDWLKGDIHDLVKAHRGCQAPEDQHKSCRHILQYNKLCMNAQRRVEHLTWLFCESLRCKEGTVFVDVEHLGLDGTTRILEVHFDHAKLDEVDKKIRAAPEQKIQKKERPEKSRASKKPAFNGFKRGEVIDLT
ncbi:hypothetical protein KCU81_g2795, partial [Aureobasidium melanogenum]|uniref:Uncharacterized protein n=1 Tax=Aureobasidium melanogenum (strain CBS 110374) TaxID=1043003 RepID=A0A074VLE5_AURM1